jgi:hypothetical protein
MAHSPSLPGIDPRADWQGVTAAIGGGGAPFPPPPPALVQPGPHTIKTTSTVTAYRDRLVTVKLKDHGIVQRYRNRPITWTKQQVQNSIRENTPTRAIKLVAAHQLKSGDLQIFTSTSAEAHQLKQNAGWLKGLGGQAEVVVPTHGVIVHGVATRSINIKDQKATIQQMLADNYTVIPDAKISYIGWLTREGPLKWASSIVVEFTDPEMANAVIYAGMVWEGQIHQCQLYDRACRVKQCFRCNHYDHIGAQRNASQTCGYCAELHETKHCRHKGVEGFTPRCPVCKGGHTAWSNACPARKKELERVSQAKQNRSIYWHVPARAQATRSRIDSTEGVTHIQGSTSSGYPIPIQTVPTQTAVQVREEHIVVATVPAERPAERPASPLPDQTTSPSRGHTEREPQTSTGEITVQVPLAPPADEEWATPATQQESASQEPDSLIDPRLRMTTESFPQSQVSGNSQAQLPLYPLSGIEGGLPMQDANTWLNDMFNDEDNTWVPDTAQPLFATQVSTKDYGCQHSPAHPDYEDHICASHGT